MSKCEDLEPRLAEYVDGDAPSEERAAIAMHLERCPPCRGRVADERAARELLVARRGKLRGSASDELRAKCAAARPLGLVRVPMFRRPWIPLSLAATLALAVAGAFVFGFNNKVEALATQVTLDHVKCFKLSGELASAESDPAVAGPEWERAHGWSLRVPASSVNLGLQLLCVRRCFLTEGRTAHLMYKWHGEPLSVFVLPQTIGSAYGARALVEKLGHEAIIWSGEGRTYVVLARGRPSDLEPVVSYVKTNAR